MTSPGFWCQEDHPGETLGIRRHTDRCFHAVEEEVEEGYIIDGILIHKDEVAEVRRHQNTQADLSCRRPD
ncbi:MAG: hypothetical protein JJU11_13330 [Candidatus Sumerlaeia bacterium]|nr:hypothetical protein [Candidatus Sumerlaeia bacterium]